MNPYGVSTYHVDPIALNEWTQAIARARREYALHPFANHHPSCKCHAYLRGRTKEKS